MSPEEEGPASFDERCASSAERSEEDHESVVATMSLLPDGNITPKVEDFVPFIIAVIQKTHANAEVALPYTSKGSLSQPTIKKRSNLRWRQRASSGRIIGCSGYISMYPKTISPAEYIICCIS